MKWITRERPKIDRIACPWLIRRFVDAGVHVAFGHSDADAVTHALTAAADLQAGCLALTVCLLAPLLVERVGE